MNTVEQLHIGLVKAIKKGFLPTYLVKEVYWDNGVSVIQTRHLSIDGLKGKAVRIPAPTNETVSEVRDSLYQVPGTLELLGGRLPKPCVATPCGSRRVTPWLAVSFPAKKAFRSEASQQFEARQSLEFIRIYSKYMQEA